MEYEPHSHGWKINTIARLQYEISEKLKESPQKGETLLIEKMVRAWLDENTQLATRTKKEYVEISTPKISKLLGNIIKYPPLRLSKS